MRFDAEGAAYAMSRHTPKAGAVGVRAKIGKKTSEPNRPGDKFTYS